MTGPGADVPAATAQQQGEPPAVPQVLAAAVEQARAAVAEFSGAETVGDHLGVDYEDATAASHRFVALLPGYQGWQWTVVVAAHPGAGYATVSEVVLIPGSTALLAPEWLPWEQRIRPGDLGPGDLLAPAADDPRLVPGYTASGDPQVDDVAGELGLGRRWLMSPEGRAEAAQRWHDGDYGPGSAMARSTKRVCRDCGFYLPLAGSLGTMFGVCGNELSADGRVVDIGYGCGAHSDTMAPAGSGSPAFDPYDDGVLEVVEAPAASEISAEAAPGEAAEGEAAEGEAVEGEAVAEPVADEAVAEPVADEAAAAETTAAEAVADEAAAAETTAAEAVAEPAADQSAAAEPDAPPQET